MTKLPKLTYLLAGFLTVATSLLLSASASAHVVVKPAEVGVAAFQTFTAGVPNEKDIPVTGLRIVLPSGLNYVSPNVKPGWTIEVKKDGDGEEAKVSEISWTGGTIPAGQRDDFLFSAQSPDKETTVQWKAYQTYEDGTVVAWDQKPSEDHEDEDVKPYSETKVVDDLTAANADGHGTADTASTTKADNAATKANLALIFSIIAVGLGFVALRRIISTPEKSDK